jgi:transposase
MKTDSMICAGIDVAKDRLDIVLFPDGAHLCVGYDRQGLGRLDAFLGAHGVTRVGFEASGGYEWRLLAHLREGSRPAARLQPAQVRAFAKSRLWRAKNDRGDAALIAAFTASLAELPPLPDSRFDDLAAELTYIEQVEDQIATLKTMAETTRIARLKRLHERDAARLHSRRAARIALMVRTIARDAELGRRLQLLVSIKGVGERTALAMIVRLPELGRASREQIAALAGLAPYDDDSGARHGRRHVQGGRKRLRKSLFMSAFCAARCNPDLKSSHRRLRDAGKPHLVATIATARKLIILANAIIQRGTPWTPKNA